MHDATHVVLALMMCCAIAVFFHLILKQSGEKRISILELKEFYGLPYELRNILKKTMPDPVVVRQEWAKMTPDQKRIVTRQMKGIIPHAPAPPPPPPPKGMKKGFLLNKDKKKDSKDKEHDEVSTLGVTHNSNVMPANDSFLGTND